MAIDLIGWWRIAFGLLLQQSCLGGNDRNFAQASSDPLPCFFDVVLFQGVLSNYPQAATVDLASPDFAKGSHQALNDRATKLRELLDDLLHECDNINRRGVVEVGNEVHKQANNALRNLGELDGALVYRVDEQRPVLAVLLVLFIDRLCKFLLQKHDDFLHVLARHHVQSQFECLPSDVQIGARQHAQNLHSQVVQNSVVGFP